MKKYFKQTAFVALLTSIVFTSCVNDDDFEIPTLIIPFYSEEFEDITHNTILDLEGWTNFAESGSTLWKEREFSGNGYAEFNTFNSGDLSNIGWLVSPGIDMDAQTNEVLVFQSAQNFVSSAANKLEVFVSTDFDGTNVLDATWELLDANVAVSSTPGYTFISSGEIDLSGYEGNLHIAFKVTGSGTNTTLDGLFQVDNVKLFTR